MSSIDHSKTSSCSKATIALCILCLISLRVIDTFHGVPTYANLYLRWGDKAFATSNFAKARSYYKKAIHHNPYAAAAYFKTALTYQKLGDFSTALIYFNIAPLHQDPYDELLFFHGKLMLKHLLEDTWSL